MKIEAGKTYVDGENTIVGPMKHSGDPNFPFYGEKVVWVYNTYTDEGYFCGDDPHGSLDLVAEYKAPPVFIKPSAYFFGKEKILTNNDCAACTEQNNDDTGLPLLNISKPIRDKCSGERMRFLTKLDDGSYLFEHNDGWTVMRIAGFAVDDQFENIPDETAAVVRMYKNAEGNKFFVWGSDARSQAALATCELTYSDEEGWRVRDLMTTKENEQ